MRRRRLVAAVGSGALALQAGCLADSQAPIGTGSKTPSPSPSDPDLQPSVEGYRIQTVDTGCMSADTMGIDVTFMDSAVGIEGAAQTPTPCYEATIESVAVSAGELQVRVGFDEDGRDLCTECVGSITYEATIDLEQAGGVDTVTVTHASSGSQFTETRGDGH